MQIYDFSESYCYLSPDNNGMIENTEVNMVILGISDSIMKELTN